MNEKEMSDFIKITKLQMEVDNFLLDNPVIKELLHQLQAYKDKEDKLREFLENEPNDLYSTIPTKKYWVIDILQILNEGDK